MLWTSTNLPRKSVRPSTYWRSSPGHPLIRVIPHPQLLNVSIKEPSYQRGWSTKMCGEGQSSSTEAYCQCLQLWAEKVYLPVSLEACPLVESVRELCRAVGEFMTITTQDVWEGLKMDRPVDSCWPPPANHIQLGAGSPN